MLKKRLKNAFCHDWREDNDIVNCFADYCDGLGLRLDSRSTLPCLTFSFSCTRAINTSVNFRESLTICFIESIGAALASLTTSFAHVGSSSLSLLKSRRPRFLFCLFVDNAAYGVYDIVHRQALPTLRRPNCRWRKSTKA